MDEYMRQLIMATVLSQPVTVDDLINSISYAFIDASNDDILSVIDDMMQQNIIWEDCTGIMLISPGLSPIITDC